MKRLLIIFLILSYYVSNGQEIGQNYLFSTIYSTTDDIQFKSGYRIKVTDTLENGDVKFRVFKFKGNDSIISKLNNNLYAKNNKIIEHTISKSDFKKYTSRIYPVFKGVRAGFYTIPFKIRLDDFDFEQNVNFGMNIGLQYRFSRKIENRWIIEPSVGIGLSKININAKNSDVTEDRTASAFTFSGGTILHFDENINLGLFGGLDFLGNNDKDVRWKYNRKIWVGIGVNIGFSISESKSNSLTNREP